jgi:hypothetical protein
MKEIVVKYEKNFTPGSGVVSFLTWGNRDAINGLNIMFGIGKHERICGFEVTQEGIKAYIETTSTISGK